MLIILHSYSRDNFKAEGNEKGGLESARQILTS